MTGGEATGRGEAKSRSNDYGLGVGVASYEIVANDVAISPNLLVKDHRWAAAHPRPRWRLVRYDEGGPSSKVDSGIS
jgi:hypothetical protein